MDMYYIAFLSPHTNQLLGKILKLYTFHPWAFFFFFFAYNIKTYNL